MFAVLRTDREWPWSDDVFGWTGLLTVAAVLVLLTLWTYSGTRRIGWRRLVTVLLLRLAALAIAFLLVIRPYFAQEQAVLDAGVIVVFARNPPDDEQEDPEGAGQQDGQGGPEAASELHGASCGPSSAGPMLRAGDQPGGSCRTPS